MFSNISRQAFAVVAAVAVLSAVALTAVVHSNVFEPQVVEAATITPIVLPSCHFDKPFINITQGDSATLNWTSNDAVSASLNNGIGTVDVNGQVTVSPTVNTSYTLTVTSSTGNKSSCVASVAVDELVVRSCDISINRNQVEVGESVTVSWTTEGYDVVTVDGQSVSATGNNTYTLTQAGQKIYELHAETSDGKQQCNQSVTVDCIAPTIACTLDGTPSTITAGESSVLTWTTTNADTASVDQGIGAVALNDSLSVSPLVTTTYTLTAAAAGQSVQCPFTVNVTPVTPEPTCTLAANPTAITEGGSSVLTWTTTNADTVKLDGVTVAKNDSQSVSPVTTTSYTLMATGNGKTVTCPATVTVTPIPNPVCSMMGAPTSIKKGESAVLTWTTSNAVSAAIDQGIGSVALNDNTSVSPATTTTYTLTAENSKGTQVQCSVTIAVTDQPAPLDCSILANPLTIDRGATSTITWTSTNAVSAAIDMAIGNVSLNGDIDVSPTDTTTYTLTVADAAGATKQCPITVTVNQPAVTSCTMTGSPLTITKGDSAALTWTTTNATAATLDQGIGSVALNDTATVTPATTTTYTLTATGANNSPQCPVTIEVVEPGNLTCTLNLSDTNLDSGSGYDLTWNTTGATTVSINQSIGSVTPNVSGKKSFVMGDSSVTYTLTAEDATGSTVQCSKTISPNTGGGGGGGSSSPRCDLDASAETVRPGEEVVLTWDNSKTNDMILTDNRGNILIDTEEDTDIDEDEGSITVTPTKATEYTMTVFRGSRDRTCSVQVDVEDEVTVIEHREQTPQVAGISLTQVPYTGFEAGPFLTILFYTILGLWSVAIAYILVVREEPVFGFSLGGSAAASATKEKDWEALVDEMHEASVAEDIAAPVATEQVVPANLPVGTFSPSTLTAPVIGYANKTTEPVVAEETPTDSTEHEANELENAAHQEGALLSSDAVQYFMTTFTTSDKRLEALRAVIIEAKTKYPTEGGWLVLNQERVAELQTAVAAVPVIEQVSPVAPATSTSSLAEALVTGNVMAAFAMLGDRPMLALADATADLDAVIRLRQGQSAEASELIQQVTASLSTEKILAIIAALTSALDGAYTDEKAAVKMAIMKAVKAIG